MELQLNNQKQTVSQPNKKPVQITVPENSNLKDIMNTFFD